MPPAPWGGDRPRKLALAEGVFQWAHALLFLQALALASQSQGLPVEPPEPRLQAQLLQHMGAAWVAQSFWATRQGWGRLRALHPDPFLASGGVLAALALWPWLALAPASLSPQGQALVAGACALVLASRLGWRWALARALGLPRPARVAWASWPGWPWAWGLLALAAWAPGPWAGLGAQALAWAIAWWGSGREVGEAAQQA